MGAAFSGPQGGAGGAAQQAAAPPCAAAAAAPQQDQQQQQRVDSSAAASTSGRGQADACPVLASPAASSAYVNPATYNVYAQRINGPDAVQPRSPFSSAGAVLDPRNNMPLEPNQLPCPGQRQPLSTDRAVSNIPKGGTHGTWAFPSPQMVFNGARAARWRAGQPSGRRARELRAHAAAWPPQLLLRCVVASVHTYMHAHGSTASCCRPAARAALKRKGKGDDVSEEDMDGFVAAHNGAWWRCVQVDLCGGVRSMLLIKARCCLCARAHAPLAHARRTQP